MAETTITPEKKVNSKLVDLHRWFLQTFNDEPGQKVLTYLDHYAHTNFPNYNNVNATYAKAGQQELIEHIRQILVRAKKGE